MNTLNHLATGAVIALVVQKPAIALPLAFVSHFVADALPHFGFVEKGGYGQALKHRLTYVSLAYDAVGICLLLVLISGQAWYVLLSAFLAVSPDLMWVYRYVLFERKGLVPPNWKIVQFHQKIQWFERPVGLVIEILLSIVLLLMVRRYV